MKRREFITLLGGAAAWPIAARAQRAAKTARIGFLGADTQSGIESRLERFRAGLRDLGYVEGDNVLIDFRWAEGNYARLAEFAGELVRLKVDLLVTYGTPGTLAAKQATTTVPIVMIVSGDAIATGIVTSLAHPGKNVTGSTFFAPQLSAKGVELVKEALPSVSRVAILLNPDNPVMAPVLEAMVLTADRPIPASTFLVVSEPRKGRTIRVECSAALKPDAIISSLAVSLLALRATTPGLTLRAAT